MLRRASALLLFASLVVNAEDWARFRGPNGTGVASDATDLPSEADPAHNVVWKTKVPFGRSSPIVSGNRIFLTASEGNQRLTLAYDARSGRELWRRSVMAPRTQVLYKANDPASPTAAADGKNVFVFFPDLGLVSYDFAGKERWRHALGPFHNFYGMSSSPVLTGGLVILLCDQTRDSFLVALDAQSGKQRWRVERKGATMGWSVPIVYQDQLIVVGSSRVDSYFAATGEANWWTPVNSDGSMGSPVIHDGSVIVTGRGLDKPWMPTFAATVARVDKNSDSRLSVAESHGEEDWAEHFGGIDENHDGQIDEAEWNVARDFGVGESGARSIRLGGRGKLEPAATRWRFSRNVPYVPAPVLYRNVFYMVKDGGIITSLDPATGALYKQGRATGALGDYYASPVAAAGKVFLLSGEGKLTVLAAGEQWSPISVNDLGEDCYATPAIAGNTLYVRTRSTLYSFSNKH